MQALLDLINSENQQYMLENAESIASRKREVKFSNDNERIRSDGDNSLMVSTKIFDPNVAPMALHDNPLRAVFEDYSKAGTLKRWRKSMPSIENSSDSSIEDNNCAADGIIDDCVKQNQRREQKCKKQHPLKLAQKVNTDSYHFCQRERNQLLLHQSLVMKHTYIIRGHLKQVNFLCSPPRRAQNHDCVQNRDIQEAAHQNQVHEVLDNYQNQKELDSCLRIQALIRGFLKRQKYAQHLEQVRLKEKEFDSCIRIQSTVRGFFTRRVYAQHLEPVHLKEKEYASCVRIQSTVRGFLARLDYAFSCLKLKLLKIETDQNIQLEQIQKKKEQIYCQLLQIAENNYLEEEKRVEEAISSAKKVISDLEHENCMLRDLFQEALRCSASLQEEKRQLELNMAAEIKCSQDLEMENKDVMEMNKQLGRTQALLQVVVTDLEDKIKNFANENITSSMVNRHHNNDKNNADDNDNSTATKKKKKRKPKRTDSKSRGEKKKQLKKSKKQNKEASIQKNGMNTCLVSTNKFGSLVSGQGNIAPSNPTLVPLCVS